jgi:hypothetical protein
MYTSTAKIQYGPGVKIWGLVDKDLVKYYQSLIPKYIDYQKQKYEPHISLIRVVEQLREDFAFKYWWKYQAFTFEFTYDGILRHDDKYIWMDVRSPEIVRIREELGLRGYRYGDCSHITIGNFKHK